MKNKNRKRYSRTPWLALHMALLNAPGKTKMERAHVRAAIADRIYSLTTRNP